MRGVEAGVDDAGKVEDGSPLAVTMGLPDDLTVQESGGLGGAEVVVEVEVFGVGGLVLFAEVEGLGGLPLGGEDEGGVVVAGFGGGELHLLDGEVLDGGDFEGASGIADLRAGELGGRGPGGEDGGLGEALIEDVDGLLVEDDHVAVGEVVLGGEGVGGIDPDSGEEGDGGEGGEGDPAANVAAPGGDAEEEDEGIEGKEIAGEERSAKDGEGDPVA